VRRGAAEIRAIVCAMQLRADDAMFVVARALKQAGGVKVLNLVNNSSIGAEGAAVAISEALKHMFGVDLSGNSIDNEGAAVAIADALKHVAEALVLGNDIDAATEQRIREMLRGKVPYFRF